MKTVSITIPKQLNINGLISVINGWKMSLFNDIDVAR